MGNGKGRTIKNFQLIINKLQLTRLKVNLLVGWLVHWLVNSLLLYIQFSHSMNFQKFRTSSCSKKMTMFRNNIAIDWWQLCPVMGPCLIISNSVRQLRMWWRMMFVWLAGDL